MSSAIHPRGGHSTSIISHYAIVFGGSNNELALKDTWALDIDSGHWQEFKTGGKGPSPRYAHSANVLAQNLILVFGGFDSHKYYNDMYILDLTTRLWSTVTPQSQVVPSPRYAHSATLVGRQLVVFGGCGPDSTPLSDLWTFDLETLEWSQPDVSGTPPEPRSYHTASLVGDKILFFGGKKAKTWYNDVVMLDIGSRSWTPLQLAPPKEGQVLQARAYHTASVVNDNFICVLGGFNGSQMCKEVLLFDLSTMRWLIYGKTDMCRCKHSTNFVRGSLLLFGGHDGSSFLNVFAKLETDPLFEFIASQNPRQSLGPPTINIQLKDAPIDKENAIVHNMEGMHVKPEVLEDHVKTVNETLDSLTVHLSLFDESLLEDFVGHLEVVLQKARDEAEVRKVQRDRKKAKPGVRFGEVKVREHKRTVGHGSVTSDGGPALGIDSQYTEKLMRRLSSYENLREAVRVAREEYMKVGYVTPQERARLLIGAGTSRPSMESNMREMAAVKEARAETTMCAAGVIISEAGLLPTKGNLKLSSNNNNNNKE